MVFDLGESTQYVVDKMSNITFLHGVLSNPIYTALLLVAVIVIIAMFIFWEYDAYVLLRFAFYTFIISCGILFLHNRIIMDTYDNESKNSEIVNTLHNPIQGGNDYNIVPKNMYNMHDINGAYQQGAQMSVGPNMMNMSANMNPGMTANMNSGMLQNMNSGMNYHANPAQAIDGINYSLF